MRWTFNRVQGKLISPSNQEYAAYSGHGAGVNNPALERVHDVGPIPAGWWDIGAPHDSKHGPFTLTLTPQAGTEVYGRSDFLCHGDEVEHPGQFLASLGCVIAARAVRELIWSSGVHVLFVI